VTSIGFQTISSVIRLLEPINRANSLIPIDKCLHIFYITDFDPAGDCIPIALSRLVEFYRLRYAPTTKIVLHHLALTKKQEEDYSLRGTPIKATDARRENFQSRRAGMDATELDALEALHPGALAHIVREAIKPYRDGELEMRLQDVKDAAKEHIHEEWNNHIEDEANEALSIEVAVQDIYADYRESVRAMNEAMQERLRPYEERLAALREAVETKRTTFQCTLPERPQSNLELPDETDVLFDSSRSYMEQLEQYKKHQQGTEE
jgi:hypothetical protein